MTGLILDPEEEADRLYLESLGRNQRMGLMGVPMPRGGGEAYGNPMTPGALAGDVYRGASALAQGMSPQVMGAGMLGAAGGVTIPPGAQIIEDDAGGRYFLLPDGTTRPIGDTDRRHGGLLDLAEAFPMAGMQGGPAGTVGAGARSRARAVPQTAEEAAGASSRRAGQPRVPSVRQAAEADAATLDEALAAPVVQSSGRRVEAATLERQDRNLRDYLDRQAAKPDRDRARPLLPGTDVFDLRSFDLTRTPDVPQYRLDRFDPTEGRRRGVSPRMQDLITNPDVERQYTELVRHGRDNLMGREWYNMDPVRARFVTELGPEQGEAAFRQFTQNIAAASPRSNIIDNMRNASHYFTQEASGMPLPAKQPAPYGHLAQNLHRQNALTIRSPEGWDLMRNPKPPSFAENLSGNQMPGTMDAHAISVPAILSRDPRFLMDSTQIPAPAGVVDPVTGKPKLSINPRSSYSRGVFDMDEAQRRSTIWSNMPQENEYAALERWFGRIGEGMGMTPAQTQASGWVGGGRVSGLTSPPLPAAEILDRVIARTARERGLDPEEVLRRMIRREQALLAQGPDAAGLAGRGLLAEEEGP